VFNRIPRHHMLVYLFYLCVAIGMTHPAITSLSTDFIGGDTSDAYEMARHIWWFKTAIQTGQDIFWQSNLGYPDGFSGVTLWANPLQFFPMWLFAFVMPLATAYNITILLTIALNGWAMYFLARHRFEHNHHTPALIAGLIYMIFPVFQGHLFDGHAGLMVQWGVPLLVYTLFEYMDTGRRRWFGLSILFFLIATSGHALQFIYLLAPLMMLVILARLYRRDLLGATRAFSVSLVGSLLLLVYWLPTFNDTLQTTQYVQSGGFVRYSIDALGIASPSFLNSFWADITQYSSRVLGTNLSEGASYIGVLGALLVLIGLLSNRRARWWLLVAITAWIFALGPVLKFLDQPVTITVAGYQTIVPLPYALFIDLPFFELARTPGRFMFLFAVAFALMAGYGMAYIWTSQTVRNSRKVMRYMLVILFGVIIFRDYQFFESFPMQTATIPQAFHDLRDRTDIRAVFNVPYDNLLSAKEALYLQTAHNKALIAGQISRETPVDPAVLELLSTMENALLSNAGADIVVINKRRAEQMNMLETLQNRALIHLGSAIYEDDNFAIYETPIMTAQPDSTYTVTPDEQQDVTYIYKEQPGWLEYTTTLTADNRTVHMYLNDELLHTWAINGTQRVSLPLPIGRRGYNTFRIALDPPCPENIESDVLVCKGVTVSNIEIVPLTDGPIYEPIRLEDGIELAAFYKPDDFAEDSSVRLWWRFDNPRAETDVRFIHVLDENRRLMAQADDSVGNIEGDTQWTETVSLDISDLPAGNYIMLTGWYALPDAIRYDVLTNVDGAQDNTIVLGSFTIEGDE